jgi:hypothetical protein
LPCRPRIAEQFDQFLARKTLSPRAKLLFAEWLRFYWDFCQKYHHDSLHPGSLPLFLQKLHFAPESAGGVWKSPPWRGGAQRRRGFSGMNTQPKPSASTPEAVKNFAR